MTYYSDTNTAPASALSRIAAFFDGLNTRRRQYRVYRQTFNELAELNNRELADLGLSRSDIRRVSREAAGIAS
ncbi:DUF1127 domain-containing protein [Sulfitobacter sp. S190]|uniref:DUF1127 domain-containing protein n=1 Tax=Sulfitobacter sp. S190 TaxID=2867022 RepID=UPI0021A5FB08|nr:DUF1127 domain-containing protein [Sulfitobacter sp. S190]UWR23602.1 DUF1127 domain-containing protein [Sulfitobacter sp. S190]